MEEEEEDETAPCTPTDLSAGLGRSPVVSEGLLILRVERAGGGKHDGGVQIGDDTGHAVGCCDAGLGAFVTSLEGRQHQGHLRTNSTHGVTLTRLLDASGVPGMTAGDSGTLSNQPSCL